MQHPTLGSLMGLRIGPPGRPGGRRTPRRPKKLKTLHFPVFWRPAEQLCPLLESSDKVPTICQIVYFSLDISFVGAILCSRLQPQPLCASGRHPRHPNYSIGAFHPYPLKISGGPKCRMSILVIPPSSLLISRPITWSQNDTLQTVHLDQEAVFLLFKVTAVTRGGAARSP